MRRVLVVDDADEIRALVSMALEDEGFEVVTAPHGAAALEVLATGQPDAIVLDMQMPVMDGWEFARRYRDLPGPHAPIIVLTAARDVAQRCRQIEADGCLGKPFDLDDLVNAIRDRQHSHSKVA